MAFSNGSNWKDLFTNYKGTSGWALSDDVLSVITDINSNLQKGIIPTSKELRKKFEGVSGATKDLVDDIDKYIQSSKGAQVQTQKWLGVNTWAATGLKGLATAVKAAAAQIKLALIQFALFTAAIWAISKAIEIGKELWYTYSDSTMAATKRAEDATVALKETQDELQSINDELKTVKDRLKELQAQGPLTLTEQDELRQLQLENAELERRVELLKEEERIRKEQQAQANYDVLQSYTNKLPIFASKEERTDRKSLSLNAHYGTIGEQIQHYVDLHQMVQDEISALDPTDANYLDNLEKLEAELAQYAKQIQALSKIVVDNPIDPQYLDNEEARQQAKANNQAANRGLYELGIIGPMDYLESSLSTEQWKYFDQEMQKLAQESNVTADSIKQAFDNSIPEVFTLLEDLGFTVDDLAEHYAALGRVIEETPQKSLAISDTTAELKAHEEKLDALSAAYNEFITNSGKVSSATLSAFNETFALLKDTKEFDNFIKVLGDSSSSVTQLQTAIDDLVTAYFNQDGIIQNLDDNTLDLYASQLKQMGVVNALEVAQHHLNLKKIESMDCTDDEIEAFWDEYVALDNVGEQAIDTGEKLRILNAYQQTVAGNDFAAVCKSHASLLYGVAIAAGESAAYLAEYSSVMMTIAKFEADASRYGIYEAGSLMNETYNNLLQRAASLKGKAKAEFEALFNAVPEVDFSPVVDENSGKIDNDKYNAEKAKLDNQLERNLITYNDYYKKLVKLGNKYFKKGSDDMATHYATLADVRRSAYAKYQSELDNQLANNSITLNTYYTKSQALADKWLDGRKANEEDYAKAVTTIYDKVVEQWNNRVSAMETQMERWTLDKTWAPGTSELSVWQDQLAQLQKDYVAGLFDDTDEYYDIYYDILKRIRDLESEELEKQLDDLEDRADGVQGLIDIVDDMLRQRVEDQIDALEGLEDKYQDIVDAKKESLDLTREELAYQRELEESNKELADLQAKAALLALDDSREGKAQYAAIMEEIRNKQLEISDSQADHTYDATTDALDEATEKYQAHIQEKIDDLNEMTANQGEWLQYVYKYIETTDPSQLFEELRNYNYKYGDGMNQTVADIQSASRDLLTAFNSNVPAILEYLKAQQNITQAKIDSVSGGSGDGPSDNYTNQLSASLNKAVQASKTQEQKDSDNRKLVTQIKSESGLNAWYDDKNKVVYMGSEGDRRVTAGAHNIIEQMKALNAKAMDQAAKEKQMKALHEQLKKKWSYKTSTLTWSGNTAKLFKEYNGKQTQIFHSGVQQGFVSDGKPLQVSSKQRELLAKLQAGEIVLNRTDQERLMVQMQVLEGLTDKLKKLDLDSRAMNVDSSPSITLTVEAPVVIQGNADPDALKKLEKFGDEIADKTLTTLNEALRARGYGGHAKSNAMKKR